MNKWTPGKIKLVVGLWAFVILFAGFGIGFIVKDNKRIAEEKAIEEANKHIDLIEGYDLMETILLMLKPKDITYDDALEIAKSSHLTYKEYNGSEGIKGLYISDGELSFINGNQAFIEYSYDTPSCISVYFGSNDKPYEITYYNSDSQKAVVWKDNHLDEPIKYSVVPLKEYTNDTALDNSSAKEYDSIEKAIKKVRKKKESQ